MACYTINEVKISGSYPVNEILELHMNVGVNRHGLLTYGGLVSEDAAQKYIQQSADRQVVEVSLRDEVEFCGYPQEIVTEHHNNHCYLRVTLVTGSQLMDTTPCNRFFQDISYTFEDMLAEAFEDSGTGALVAIHGVKRIRSPILQYRETDWQFTLRMAGRLGTVVIPNVTSAEPQVTLGVPKRQVIDELNHVAYSVNRNIMEFRHEYAMHNPIQRNTDAFTRALSNGVNYQNFLRYRIKSSNRYKLGDSIRVDGKTLTVMQKNLVFEQGEIQEIYVLGHEHEFAVPFRHNKHVSGLELEGSVLERSGQDMHILLEIDAGRKDCGKTWFSYSPVTNNGMYSMPLVDEKVMLQWQSETDDDVLIVRPDRKNSYDTQPPAERHFLTDCENHLMMIPGKIEYTNPVGSMKWLTSTGFDISTDKNVEIKADQDVIITSQAQVEINSPERITAAKIGLDEVEDETQITQTLTPISSIDMLSNYLHIKAPNQVATKSKSNDFKKSALPERIPKLDIDKDVFSKLEGATAAMCDVSNSSKLAEITAKVNAGHMIS